MNDDELDLRIYARRPRRPRMPVRPARTEPAPTEPARPPPRVAPDLPVVAPDVAEEGVAVAAAVTGVAEAAPAPASIEDQILRILRAPPEWGEAVEGAFNRKERELAAVFEALAPAEANELFRRLASPGEDDPIATSFGRMVPERRGRLLAFLVGAPRRAVIERAQRRSPAQPGRKDE